MAFNINRWGRQTLAFNSGRVVLQDASNDNAPAFFTYASSTDDLSTVEAANYFSEVVFDLAVDDLIFLKASDDSDYVTVATLNRELGTITVTSGGGIGTVTVPNGGTGRTSFTVDGIIIGGATTTGPLQQIVNGASGTILRSSGVGAIPAFSTATYPATTTVSQLLYSSSANVVGGLATVNRASLSTNATGVPTWLALTDGQFVIGSTAGAPAAGTITAGTGVSVVLSSNGLTINSTGGGLATLPIAGTTQAAAVNTKYIALNVGQTTLTLPATYAVGDVIALIGSTANTGGWIVQAGTGDTVRVNNATTSAGGTVTCTAVAGQTIYLECDVANTSWVMTGTVSVLLTTA